MYWTGDIREDVIYAMLLAMAGILVAWCGLSRTHWSIRFAVGIGVAWLLVPTGAYDPIVYYLLILGQVTAVLTFVRVIQHRRSASTENAPTRHMRFSLKDLLLATSLIGAAMGIIVLSAMQMFEETNLLLGSSVAAAALVLAASYLALGPPRRIVKVVVAIGFPTLAAVVWHFYAWHPAFFATRSLWMYPSVRLRLAVQEFLFPATVLMMITLGIVVITAGRKNAPGRRLLWLARGLVLLLVFVSAPIGFYFYYRLTFREQPLTVELPSPNGHDCFTQAARSLSGVYVPDPETDPPKAFASFAANHHQALELVRKGSALPCRAPLPAENIDEFRELDTGFVLNARPLGRALQAEAIAHAEAGDYPAAAQSCVDCVRYAAQGSRGGLFLAMLCGIAVEAKGVFQLKSIRAKLDAKTCRRMMEQLLEIDERRERVDEIYRREKTWGERASDWRIRLCWITADLAGVQAKDLARLRQTQQRRDVMVRLMVTVLAVRAFGLENGAPPKTLDDLVPDYLPEVPLDPYSHTQLRYLWDEQTPLVYSVGPDGDDDGGKALSWDQLTDSADADFVLEACIEMRDDEPSPDNDTDTDESR